MQHNCCDAMDFDCVAKALNQNIFSLRTVPKKKIYIYQTLQMYITPCLFLDSLEDAIELQLDFNIKKIQFAF